MNTKTFLLTVLLMTAGICMSCSKSDDSDTIEGPASAAGNTDKHAWIDLGLPSGTLWATTNVGASKPEDYGAYFAWGETSPKTNYDWSTYKWGKGSPDSMTKYCTQTNDGYNGFTDGKTELEPADDAATVNWGSGWRMPTIGQIQELFNNNYTTTAWTQVNGVNGVLITSRSNGSSVFLPAAGYRYDTILDVAGEYGDYWSCSLRTNYSRRARNLMFSSGDGIDDDDDRSRYSGRSVRPVRVKN